MKLTALAAIALTLGLTACGDPNNPYHPKGTDDYDNHWDARHNRPAQDDAASSARRHYGDEHLRAKAEDMVDYMFPLVDLNRDGVITRTEHNSFGTKMFIETDTNRDNVLSYQEVVEEKMDKMEDMRNARRYDDDYPPRRYR